MEDYIFDWVGVIKKLHAKGFPEMRHFLDQLWDQSAIFKKNEEGYEKAERTFAWFRGREIVLL